MDYHYDKDGYMITIEIPKMEYRDLIERLANANARNRQLYAENTQLKKMLRKSKSEEDAFEKEFWEWFLT